MRDERDTGIDTNMIRISVGAFQGPYKEARTAGNIDCEDSGTTAVRTRGKARMNEYWEVVTKSRETRLVVYMYK